MPDARRTAAVARRHYWHIRGNLVHADSCLSAECVAFIKYEGKRDGKIVE